MINAVIRRAVCEKISAIGEEDNVIVVLKGIPVEVMDSENCDIDLEQVAKDRFGHFMKIYGGRKYISYEEYLLLKSFIVQQYKKIYIVNNNLFINQYPLEARFSDDIRRGMLNHFADSEDDEREIGDIGEVISIYTGVRAYNTYLIGAYCEDDQAEDIKVHKVNLFEAVTTQLPVVSPSEIDAFLDVTEEPEYIEAVQRAMSAPDRLNLRISNYVGDRDQLRRHIGILATVCEGHTQLCYVQNERKEDRFEHKDAYNEILRKHWGKKSFRTFAVYDPAKLDEGIKDTYEVSQEQIISDIVQQVEICQKGGRDYRDLFVTAPTGAGKSAMFQIPAIYLAERYHLLTLVISPLIGLMNDQVKNLEVRNYNQAKTIHSDISPIVKEEIMGKVREGTYNILYLSPETLLSRSDVEQLIGDRTIGMIVIDEAHIVTTWGKQFRPDYWYLGDHIRTLRSNQTKRKGKAFLIATFTATAIYHGVEDMYEETRNGLHMLDPITYLGYVKRNDITIEVKKVKKARNVKTEYETDKYDHIIKRALITNKKTLVYFPTVALIERCYEYLNAKGMGAYITKYHGSMSKEGKAESYERFLTGERKIMLATKAFGMGIDIEDIESVVHFAPTGNVCDYVQEIGRAARQPKLTGEAFYEYDTSDFKHINRLHGLSAMQKYQLIEVVKKIEELYRISLQRNRDAVRTRKRNAMLVDAENFTYIFQNPVHSEDANANINKVKTALLIVQKDFENKIGFSPITVRPIPMFAVGFFAVEPGTQARLSRRYKGCVQEMNAANHICRVLLDKIWHKDFQEYSFPQFKYLIYSGDSELEFNSKYTMKPALCVSIEFADEYMARFQAVWSCLRKKIQESIVESRFVKPGEMVSALGQIEGISKYKAQAVCEVFLSAIALFQKDFSKTNASIMRLRPMQSGEAQYQFQVAVSTFFNWVESGLKHIVSETRDGELYIVNSGGNDTRRYSIILGLLEAMDVLGFSMIGGANSQLYIYISQIRPLQNIVNNPKNYRNRLLDMVSERHLISVKMLTYLFESGFNSAGIWDVLEDYFVGKIPDKVRMACLQENPGISFPD